MNLIISALFLQNSESMVKFIKTPQDSSEVKQVMAMDSKLLSDILATEQEIRLQIDAMEQQRVERLETVRQDLDRILDNESRILQAELEQALTRAEQRSELEADGLLAEARAFALRLENLQLLELDRVVIGYLSRIIPEGEHDRQDEQA